MIEADFLIYYEGSISLLECKTEAARDWVDEHLPSDAQRFCGKVVVEHRYIGDIVNGINNDGLLAIDARDINEDRVLQ